MGKENLISLVKNTIKKYQLIEKRAKEEGMSMSAKSQKSPKSPKKPGTNGDVPKEPRNRWGR